MTTAKKQLVYFTIKLQQWPPGPTRDTYQGQIGCEPCHAPVSTPAGYPESPRSEGGR